MKMNKIVFMEKQSLTKNWEPAPGSSEEKNREEEEKDVYGPYSILQLCP